MWQTQFVIECSWYEDTESCGTGSYTKTGCCEKTFLLTVAVIQVNYFPNNSPEITANNITKFSTL